jgi:hypothetical protein
MTTSANHSMVSGVHYVGLVQPLTTSLTRLIIGGHCHWRPLQPKYWGTRPLRPIGIDAPEDHILDEVATDLHNFFHQFTFSY